MNMFTLQLITVVQNEQIKPVICKRTDTYDKLSLTIMCLKQCAHVNPEHAIAKQKLHLRPEES